MSIQFIVTPDPDNIDRPCKPVKIINELINSNRFKIALEAIFEETPEGEVEGNCHNVAVSIMADLIAADRSKGWFWVKGRKKGGMPCGSDLVHSWLENDGWVIDASNFFKIPFEDNDTKPICFIDAKLYQKQFKLKVTVRRNHKQTLRWLNKKNRQFNKMRKYCN